MKRTLLLLLFGLLVSLSNYTAWGQSKLETSGDRQYYDSSYFSITRGKYVSGELFLECYENKHTKLDSWKEYFKNGKLKKEGLMTNAEHIYVGTWKYYSSSGKIDSIVNYDNKYPISYFKALEIAETKNFKMPDMQLTEITYNNKKYWLVARWSEKPDHSGRTAECILIDKFTGEVIKPVDFKMTATY